MSHHIHHSGESLDLSVCHTISNMTSQSACQLHDSSVCQPQMQFHLELHPSVSMSVVSSVQQIISKIHG